MRTQILILVALAITLLGCSQAQDQFIVGKADATISNDGGLVTDATTHEELDVPLQQGCTDDTDCEDGIGCTQNVCKKDGTCQTFYDDSFCKTVEEQGAFVCTNNTSWGMHGCMGCNEVNDCQRHPSVCGPILCIEHECVVQPAEPGSWDMYCNDGNECTEDLCVDDAESTSLCSYVPLPSGATCNDGNLCTWDESCSAMGTCVIQLDAAEYNSAAGGGPQIHPVCDDDDEFTYDWCDSAAQQCKHVPIDTWYGKTCTTVDDCTPFASEIVNYLSDCDIVFCDGTCKVKKKQYCYPCWNDDFCKAPTSKSVGGPQGVCLLDNSFPEYQTYVGDGSSPPSKGNAAYTLTGKCNNVTPNMAGSCETEIVPCLGCSPFDFLFASSGANFLYPYFCNDVSQQSLLRTA